MKLKTLIKIIKSTKKLCEKSLSILPFWVQDFILKKFKKRYLPQIEFHIVDHCNLNCAYCDHFTPLAEEKIYEIDKILADFRQLSKIFDNIGKIYVLGGEPLLHPQLLDIFKPLKEIFPNSEVSLITNGILLAKQEENFWQTLKENKISLSMTKYPINVDYQGFLDKCRDYGIKSYFFAGVRDEMYSVQLNYKKDTDKKIAFNRCTRKKCHFLKDGKLYLCTITPNIGFLNKFFNLDFKIDKKDFVDIYKTTSAAKINKIFKKPVPFCAYCPKNEWKKVQYKHSAKKIEEWIDPSSLADSGD